MKSKLFLIFFIYIVNGSFAQQVVYSYDATGNRILRKLIVLNKTESETNNTDMLKNALTEQIDSACNILIFPNPFTHQITINSSSCDITPYLNCEIFSEQGQLVYHTRMSAFPSVLNLSNLSSGRYLLILYLSNRRMEYLIIKQ